MSTANQIEEKDPSLSGVLFMGLIVALLGAFLGFLFLATTAPKPYKSAADLQDYLEKTPNPQLLDRSYFEGPVSRGNSWEKKREALFNGSAQVVELSAGEINAWLAAKFREPSKASSNDEQSGVLILPGVPNCFIAEELGFFMNMPTEVTAYGTQHNCIVTAKGRFVAGPQVEFKMDSLRANVAAIPVEGGLGDQVIGMLLQAYAQTDEYIAFRQAWQNVDSVEIQGDSIRLTLRK